MEDDHESRCGQLCQPCLDDLLSKCDLARLKCVLQARGTMFNLLIWRWEASMTKWLLSQDRKPKPARA
jgi:hypothetical protein